MGKMIICDRCGDDIPDATPYYSITIQYTPYRLTVGMNEEPTTEHIDMCGRCFKLFRKFSKIYTSASNDYIKMRQM